MKRLHKRPSTSSPSPFRHLFFSLAISTFLLSAPSTAISLSQFQQINGFDQDCTNAYDAQINGCSSSDFNPPTAPCSASCANALASQSNLLNVLCKGISADPTTLIGLFFQGRGVSALCPTVASAESASTTVQVSTASIVGAASSTQPQTLSTQTTTTTTTTTEQSSITTRMMTMMTTVGIQPSGTPNSGGGGNSAPPIASPMPTSSGGSSAAVAGAATASSTAAAPAASTSGPAVFGGGAVPFSVSNSAMTTASAQAALTRLGMGLLVAGTWAVVWL